MASEDATLLHGLPASLGPNLTSGGLHHTPAPVLYRDPSGVGVVVSYGRELQLPEREPEVSSHKHGLADVATDTWPPVSVTWTGWKKYTVSLPTRGDSNRQLSTHATTVGDHRPFLHDARGW